MSATRGARKARKKRTQALRRFKHGCLLVLMRCGPMPFQVTASEMRAWLESYELCVRSTGIKWGRAGPPQPTVWHKALQKMRKEKPDEDTQPG